MPLSPGAVIPTPLAARLSAWAGELAALARAGLDGQTNPYDRERYQHVAQIAAAMPTILDAVAPLVVEFWPATVLTTGPKITAEAIVFNAAGEVLLIRRSDNRLWALPGGMVEVGESPAGAAAREAWEETGVQVEIIRFLGVTDSRFCHLGGHFHYHLSFLARPVGGELTVSHETTDVGYFPLHRLPELVSGLDLRLRQAFAAFRNSTLPAWFDETLRQE